MLSIPYTPPEFDLICSELRGVLNDLCRDNDEAEQREMMRNCAAYEQLQRERMSPRSNDRR